MSDDQESMQKTGLDIKTLADQKESVDPQGFIQNGRKKRN
jgi:hypothetical protein